MRLQPNLGVGSMGYASHPSRHKRPAGADSGQTPRRRPNWTRSLHPVTAIPLRIGAGFRRGGILEHTETCNNGNEVPAVLTVGAISEDDATSGVSQIGGQNARRRTRRPMPVKGGPIKG